MNADTLIASLEHLNPATRRRVARVLHMVDETAAMPALAARYAVEREPDVRDALLTAGKHLRPLADAGYRTLDAIFQFFRLNAEILHLDTEEEARLVKEVQEQADLQLLREQRGALNRRAFGNAALLIGATVAGGMQGAMFASSVLMSTPTTDVLSSNLGAARPVTRTPPTAPSGVDIQAQLRRLGSDPDPARRRSAALDLGSANNPAALPALADAYLGDEDDAVRATAQRFGKIIYWNGVYWQMTQDGTLEAEVGHRRALVEAGALPSASEPPPAPPAATPPEDLADILRRAEEARRKRGK